MTKMTNRRKRQTSKLPAATLPLIVPSTVPRNPVATALRARGSASKRHGPSNKAVRRHEKVLARVEAWME